MPPKNYWILPLSIAIFTAIFFCSQVEAETALQIGLRLLHNYNYHEAFEAFRRAAKENPNDPEVHFLLAQTIEKGHTDGDSRAMREYAIYCDLAPHGTHYDEAYNKVKNWTAAVAANGPHYGISNFDGWAAEYYKTHQYHSWDELIEPEWVKKVNQKVEFAVDVEFVSPRLIAPTDLSAPSPTSKWARDFLTAFHDQWKKTVTVPGEVEAYFFVDANSRLIPTIVHLKGTEELKGQFLKTVEYFNSNPLLAEPGQVKTLFKGRIGAKYKVYPEGTFYCFKGSDDSRPYLAHLHAKLKGTAAGLSGGSLNAEAEAMPIPADESPIPMVSASTPADEEQIKEAQEAIRLGNKQAALDLLWPLGEKDNVKACVLLSDLYKTSPTLAFIWIEKAAELGDLDAQYKVGRLYEWGNGNLKGGIGNGITWFKTGAEHGSTDCQYELGILYEMGEGVPRDLHMAQAWFEKAAPKNLDAAQALNLIRASLASGNERFTPSLIVNAKPVSQSNTNDSASSVLQVSHRMPALLSELIRCKLQFFKNIKIQPTSSEVYIVGGDIQDKPVTRATQNQAYLKIKLAKSTGASGELIDNNTCWTVTRVNNNLCLVNDPRIEYLELFNAQLQESNFVWDLILAVGNAVQVQYSDGSPMGSGRIPPSIRQPIALINTPAVKQLPKYEISRQDVYLHDFSADLNSELLKEVPFNHGFNLSPSVGSIIKFPYPNWCFWTDGIAEVLNDIWQLQRTQAEPGNIVSLGDHYVTVPGKVNYIHWQQDDFTTDGNDPVDPEWPTGKANVSVTVFTNGKIKAKVIDSQFTRSSTRNLIRSIEKLSNHPGVIFPSVFPSALSPAELEQTHQQQRIYMGVPSIPEFKSVTFIGTFRHETSKN